MAVQDQKFERYRTDEPIDDLLRACKHAQRPPPAFQNYASDDMGDEAYRTSSLEERGLLLSIRNYCWVNGSIPADLKQLARLLDVPSEVSNLMFGALIKKFVSSHPEDSSRIYVPDLARQWKELMDRRIKLSNAGMRGGQLTQASVRSARKALSSSNNASSVPSAVAKAPEKRRIETKRVEEGKQENDGMDWNNDSFSDLDNAL